MHRSFVFCCLYSLSVVTTRAQTHIAADTLAEVRAVWIATAASLDWPRSRDVSEQQASLRKIVTDLKASKFNTIFFQVRARGDAYYRSLFEPWAENLTGTLGKDPGWDPLGFLLSEAHRQGMEVHAWFNVYKIRGPYTAASSTPPHPTRAYPDWVVEHDGEVWFDPGIPEVNEYLVRVALDLVRNYTVDGIIFDFLRYPDRSFRDHRTYQRYGGGAERESWRRANVDRFVSTFHDSISTVKPDVKVGACPLGIYDGAPNGDPLGSYYAQYQDSRGWLRQGKMDYLVPQVYWSIGSSPGNPDFTALVREWAQHTAGRHVYIGIGIYKPEISKEVQAQIEIVRNAGLPGHALYRYDNTTSSVRSMHTTKAIIPPMPWKDSISVNVPAPDEPHHRNDSTEFR